jgi:type III secretion protein Q
LPALAPELAALCSRLAGQAPRLGFTPASAAPAEKLYIRPDLFQLAALHAASAVSEPEAGLWESALALKVEKEIWRIKVGGPAVARLLKAVNQLLPEGVNAGELPGELRLALLCHCLEPCLQRATSASGLALALEEDTAEQTAPATAKPLNCPFILEDETGAIAGRGEAEIPFSPASLSTLLAISRALPEKKNYPPGLRIPLSLCAGQGMFPVRVLQKAEAGDILLFEQAWRPDCCFAEVQGRALWQGALSRAEGNGGNVLTFTTPLFNQASSNQVTTTNKETSMDSQADKAGNTAARTQTPAQSGGDGKIDINELEVRLTLELEERLISLRELSAMAPGYTIVSAASPDNPVKLKINGKAVGLGKLVDVGGRLGVLVSAFNPDETGAA